MVVKLGTLILEASVFQQSPRFLLLQLGLTDRHQLQAGVLHQLCEAAVALLATVNILLPGMGLQFRERASDMDKVGPRQRARKPKETNHCDC